MNREIKFRVWCKVTKHFCDTPFYACHGGQLLWLHTSNQISISNLCDGDYVIQQFTGCYDKNDKPIYEGDIIKTPQAHMFRSNIHVVNYYRNGFWPEDICDKDDVEVIGNIFENKDLVKDTTNIS